MNIQVLGRVLLGASVVALVSLTGSWLTGESPYPCSSWSQFYFMIRGGALIGVLAGVLMIVFNIASTKNKAIFLIRIAVLMVISTVLANAAYKWWKGVPGATIFIAPTSIQDQKSLEKDLVI